MIYCSNQLTSSFHLIASAAEVFVSSLHDNGRTVATVGTKTYGKGLIQHTFPLQDGGGLRLSVAEYLTPALQHVTKVGNAQYDQNSGEYVGGGVKPDIFCPSTSGVASNVGADICVGMALDALEDADAREIEVASLLGFKQDDSQSIVWRRGGIDGGSGRRRTLTQGIMKVSAEGKHIVLMLNKWNLNRLKILFMYTTLFRMIFESFLKISQFLKTSIDMQTR